MLKLSMRKPIEYPQAKLAKVRYAKAYLNLVKQNMLKLNMQKLVNMLKLNMMELNMQKLITTC